MLDATRQAILARLQDDDVVLDIGGWADPFERADWVMDFLPYESRGYYERQGWRQAGSRLPERFTEETWVTRDICDHEPYPFEDDFFDFVICSQTLEDLHDPMWVCSEMNRIARAGYVGVPSRLEEQSWGVEGPYVGHAHHHWIVEIDGSHIDFVFKAHDIHASRQFYFPRRFLDSLSYEERIQELWWRDSISWADRSRVFPPERHAYYSEFVTRVAASRPAAAHPRRSRLLDRLRR